MMSVVFAVVIQFKRIEKCRTLFLEETPGILLSLNSIGCHVETFAEVKISTR